MAETKRRRGYVYALEYYIVWCVKYRHNVLYDEVESRLKEILMQVASDYNFTIPEMEADQDHIHVRVECTPQHSIPNMVKVLKGISARLLFKEFPGLKNKLWGGHLWNPSYFAATFSETYRRTNPKVYSRSESEVRICLYIKPIIFASIQARIKRFSSTRP